MDDSPCPRPRFIEGAVEEYLFRRWVAGDMISVPIELADPFRIEKAKAGIRRRDEQPVGNGRADVAGRSDREATVVERLRQPDNILAKLALVSFVALQSRQRLVEEIGRRRNFRT